MLIGLSLSNCIRDMANGYVERDQVVYIIAGTAIETDEHFAAARKHCLRHYWTSNPTEAVDILHSMWESGLILQPRANGGSAPSLVRGHWLEITLLGGPYPKDDGTCDWNYDVGEYSYDKYG